MMLPYRGIETQRKRWFIGCAFIILTGALLIWLPLGHPMAKLSYDVPFLFRGAIENTNVIVVLEDRAALDALGQTNWPPSRMIHAQLLDKLTAEGATMVVFDIFFRSEKPEEDSVFAESIRKHGNVILGGVAEMTSRQSGNEPGARILELKPPVPALRTNAANWGLLLVGSLDDTFGVRKLTSVWRKHDAVVWVAANRSGMAQDNKPESERWINFCGPSPSLDQVSLSEVLELDGRKLAPGIFRGKTVFVGFDPSVTPASGVRDIFSTPYTRFGHEFSPGVEVLATSYANLISRNWISEMPKPAQLLLVAMLVISSTALFLAMGKRWIPLSLPLAAAVVFALSLVLQWRYQIWWNWMVPILILLPLVSLLTMACPRLPLIAFISYRRKGGDALAVAIVHALQFRGFSAFLDVKDNSTGEWPSQLRAGIDKAPNFVLLLTEDIFKEAKDEDKDWVVQEIKHALSKQKRIISVRTKAFVFPESWPKGLEKLNAYQGLEYHHENADATFDKLVRYLTDNRKALTDTESKTT